MKSYLISIVFSIFIIFILITYFSTREREGVECKKKYLYYHPPIRDKLMRQQTNVEKIQCKQRYFGHYFTY